MINRAILVLSGLLSFNATAAEGPVSYPEGYREWTHVKSMVIHPGHPLENPFLGIHHVYANEAARDGLETGVYSDGALFAFDLLE
ncbi:MAG: cytochrome P460 family protein, partial [Thiohalocapsa sp.]